MRKRDLARSCVFAIVVLAGCDSADNDPAQPDAMVRLPDGRVVPVPEMDAGDLTPIEGPPLDENCGLGNEAAFCETFEAPHPGGRGGDIDDSRWSFTRWHHAIVEFWTRWPANSASREGHTFWMDPTFCGGPIHNLLPPDDVRSCTGVGVDGLESHQLNTMFDDQGDFGIMSMRIRQPFDFSGGGRVVWDVDAKANPFYYGHGWWTEVWITEDPSPIPYHDAPTVFSMPRNGVGVAFQTGGGEGGPCGWFDPEVLGTTVNRVVVSRDYDFHRDENPDNDSCIRSADGVLSHFELRITQDSLELWASDAGDPSSFRRRSVVNNLDLPFTRGYVHFQHAHYNAMKDGPDSCDPTSDAYDGTRCTTPVQTFRWDNIGFTGPRYATPRSYDVPNNDAPGVEGGLHFGYDADDGRPRTFRFADVSLAGAVGAWLNVGTFAEFGSDLTYRVNGGASRTLPIPGRRGDRGEGGYRSVSLPLQLEELREGENSVEISLPAGDFHSVGNIDLTIDVNE